MLLYISYPNFTIFYGRNYLLNPFADEETTLRKLPKAFELHVPGGFNSSRLEGFFLIPLPGFLWPRSQLVWDNEEPLVPSSVWLLQIAEAVVIFYRIPSRKDCFGCNAESEVGCNIFTILDHSSAFILDHQSLETLRSAPRLRLWLTTMIHWVLSLNKPACLKNVFYLFTYFWSHWPFLLYVDFSWWEQCISSRSQVQLLHHDILSLIMCHSPEEHGLQQLQKWVQ